METTGTKTTAHGTKLYWSERGAIACLEHAPFRGSDTWRWERWRLIKAAEAMEFEREVGRAPECETCAAIARRKQSAP